MKKALVIIPTTGSEDLKDSLRSVLDQNYKNTHVLLVVDGPQFSNSVSTVLKDIGVVGYGDRIFRCDLPFNTGGGGFYGHRIMAAFSHLIPDYDYVLFLDQDNWYNPEHVCSMVEEIERKGLDWCHSLRSIYDKDKNFVIEDNCESLGKWPAWIGENVHLIDTSTYCFKTDFFKHVSYLWDFGWGADRRFFTILKDQLKHTNYSCTGLYTLNYRLGGNEGSVTKEFFIEGNQRILSKYGNRQNFPWLTKNEYITINF